MSTTSQNSEIRTDDRIVVVAHAWYGDTIGGEFRLASEFAEDLVNDGFHVDYVCCGPADRPDNPPSELLNGVWVHRYPPAPAGIGPIARMRRHIGHTRRLVRQIGETGRIQAVSGHSPLQFLGAAKCQGSRAFLNYTVHSPFDDEFSANVASVSHLRRVAQIPAVRSARWIDRRNCQLADRVQCLSQYTLATMQRKHGHIARQKGCVAPGWVDYESFSAAKTREQARESLGERWQAKVPLFFTLRRLEARMGLDTLIEASACIRDRGHDFRLLIGGGGSLRAPLEQRVRDRNLTDHIQFLGRIPEADLAECYAAADCFVLPTRALECFGLIVLESFAAGTPVIASRAAAIPEIASRQGPDWDFEPGNPQQLAERMEAFITHRCRPAVDLRAVARNFDRRTIFPLWRDLLLSDDRPLDPVRRTEEFDLAHEQAG